MKIIKSFLWIRSYLEPKCCNLLMIEDELVLFVCFGMATNIFWVWLETWKNLFLAYSSGKKNYLFVFVFIGCSIWFLVAFLKILFHE